MNWQRVIDKVVVTLNPAYWISLGWINRAWDSELNARLDAGQRFECQDDYVATLGGVEVWVANHPYASFSRYLPARGKSRSMPTRATRRRAMREYRRAQNERFSNS